MLFNAAEDTFFKVKKTLNCRGRTLDLSTPVIMGIINITPDSFYSASKVLDKQSMLIVAEKMITEGAKILDIGGQSTRPGAVQITAKEEWDRIKVAIPLIHRKFPEVVISVDTFYAEVARKALEEGASMINDVSAGETDSNMFPLVSSLNVPYVIMHMQGTPATMQIKPQYSDVVTDVLNFFIRKVAILKKTGLHDIIIDPGFGFGKSTEDNFTLLKNLSLFNVLGCPVLAGISRKSMVTRPLNIKTKDALNASTCLHTIALLNGASILRVHDVAEALEVKRLIDVYKA